MSKYLIEPEEPSIVGMKASADTLSDALEAAWELRHYFQQAIAIFEVTEGVPHKIATVAVTFHDDEAVMRA